MSLNLLEAPSTGRELQRKEEQRELYSIIVTQHELKDVREFTEEIRFIPCWSATSTYRIRQQSLAGFAHSADGVVHVSLARKTVHTSVQGLEDCLRNLDTHTDKLINEALVVTIFVAVLGNSY